MCIDGRNIRRGDHRLLRLSHKAPMVFDTDIFIYPARNGTLGSCPRSGVWACEVNLRWFEFFEMPHLQHVQELIDILKAIWLHPCEVSNIVDSALSQQPLALKRLEEGTP